MDNKCMIPKCMRPKARMGLCLVCYGKAKNMVESGNTTWEKLAELGLCKGESDPFTDAYSEATREDEH